MNQEVSGGRDWAGKCELKGLNIRDRLFLLCTNTDTGRKMKHIFEHFTQKSAQTSTFNRIKNICRETSQHQM